MPSPSSGLQAGPSEITVEILKWLNCADLLSVGQTCKYLNDVSRLRYLWVNLVSAQRTFLEEPINSYTTEQLQFHVCKQSAASQEWQSDEPNLARCKNIDVPRQDHMILIKGGRWLLLGLHTGAVVAYDLDSFISRQMTIVEAGMINLPISKLVVDMDDSAPHLTFKLAVLFNRSQATRIQIYQVSLAGHGSQAELIATSIISIYPNIRWSIIFASLRGEHFCRGSTMFPPLYYKCVEVFPWRNCTKSGSYPVSTIFLGVQNRVISGEILPGNQILLLLQEGCIAIYDLPEPRVQTHNFEVSQPHWKAFIKGFGQQWGDITHVKISTPHLGHLSSYIACTTLHGIYGVTVPVDPGGLPEIAKLLDFAVENKSSFAVGLEKAFIWDKSNGFFTGTFSFKKPTPAIGLKPAARRWGFQWPFRLRLDMRMVMDEQTGRVVVGIESQDYVRVLDFAREIKLKNI